MAYTYDLIVIGGGPVGLISSKIAAGFGKKVALIEKERLGGDCTITGCVPSKTLIALANYIHYAQDLAPFNCNFSAACLDTSKVLEHVHQIVEEIYAGHTPELLQQQGIEVIFGEASFIDQHTILVNGNKLTSHSFVIGTGSRPFVPPIEGLDSVPYLTNKNFFDLTSLPRSLLILGGGPIGIELGSCLQRLGTQVTIIEQNERILPREEEELVILLSKNLQKDGVILKTRHKAIKAFEQDDQITLECLDSNQNKVIVSAEKLLIAVGRRPNIEGLNLENAGVAVTPKGITVSQTLQTTAKNIYAAGDVVGPYLFSHMAEYQATIATRNALIPFFKKKVDYRQVVWVTFSDPELASSGLTEQAAKELYGDRIKVYRSSYAQSDRPRTDGRTEGMAKYICDSKGYLIGAHIYGARAGELIAELQVSKYYRIKLASLYQVIHPYPTYSAITWQAAKKAYIESLQNQWFLKLVRKLMGYFKRNR